jgi:hypothetical protein
VLAVVLLAAALTAAGLRLAGDDGSTTKRAVPTTAPQPGATTAPTGGVTPSADAGASPGEPAYISKIKREVSEARGLPWKAPLAVQLVSKDELARRIREVTARDDHPDRDAGDEATLKLLHLIPADLDYSKAIDDLLSEQVLGFYDGTTKELFVGDSGSGGDEPDPDVKVSIAHELDHALTDQQFDFQAQTDALDKADKQEEAEALTSLIEGDAVTLQFQWAEKNLSQEDQAAALLGGGSGDTSVLEHTPAFLRELLLFPYTSGVSFVQDLVSSGNGFSKVDDAYRSPPTSTEEILHPDLYTSGKGAWTPPDLPDLAAATGCDAVRRNTLGEFSMDEILKEHTGSDEADKASQGWNGDVFQTVRCGGTVAMVDRWKTDTPDDATRLEKALDSWAKAWSGGAVPGPGGRFAGSGGAARVVRTGSQVDLVLGGDAPTADRLGAAAGLSN